MRFYDNVLGLIGNTPLVRINNLTKQHGIKARVFGKMESLNPGYSVKDRIGISMIDWAEREGALKKGGTIIEATSGNTGIGLALTAIALTVFAAFARREVNLVETLLLGVGLALFAVVVFVYLLGQALPAWWGR